MTEMESTMTEKSLVKQDTTFADRVRAEAGTIAGVDDTTAYRYRFPRLGKVHLGVKKPVTGNDGKPLKNQDGSIKERPDKTDYFVLPPELIGDEKFRAVLKSLDETPDKPRKLPITLISDSIGDCVKSSLDFYGSNKGLRCRSHDGIRADRVNPETGEIVQQECPNVNCPDYIKKDCQCVTRFRFFLPDARGVGVWQLDSRSKNNRANLPCEMQTIRAATQGKLRGIDLILTLEPEEKVISLPDRQTKEPKQQKVKVFLLHLRTDLTLREVQQAAKDGAADWSPDEVEDVDTSYDPIVMGNAPNGEDFMAEAHEEPVDADYSEEEPVEPEGLRDELLDKARAMLAAGWKSEALWPSVISSALHCKPSEAPALLDCSPDQLQTVIDFVAKTKAANKKESA